MEVGERLRRVPPHVLKPLDQPSNLVTASGKTSHAWKTFSKTLLRNNRRGNLSQDLCQRKTSKGFTEGGAVNIFSLGWKCWHVLIFIKS